MSKYIIDKSTLDAIADAILAKTGGSTALTPAQMVSAIEGIGGSTKTYNLTATIGGVVFTIEVVRYYTSDGVHHDFISKVNMDSALELDTGDSLTATSVTNTNNYTGTVTSGVLDCGTYETSGEGDEYVTYQYKVYMTINNGNVVLNMDVGEGYGYYTYFSIAIDYNITTSN